MAHSRRCVATMLTLTKKTGLIIVALACRNAWNPLPRGTLMFRVLSNGRSSRLSKRF
jgi:hypothetical protein